MSWQCLPGLPALALMLPSANRPWRSAPLSALLHENPLHGACYLQTIPLPAEQKAQQTPPPPASLLPAALAAPPAAAAAAPANPAGPTQEELMAMLQEKLRNMPPPASTADAAGGSAEKEQVRLAGLGLHEAHLRPLC
jgi:hypothetical protein